MFKIISLTLPLLILVGCHQLPKTDTAIKYYDTIKYHQNYLITILSFIFVVFCGVLTYATL